MARPQIPGISGLHPSAFILLPCLVFAACASDDPNPEPPTNPAAVAVTAEPARSSDDVVDAARTLSTPTFNTPTDGPAIEDAYIQQRERLVTTGIAGLGVTDSDVLDAMRAVPRHLFVPESYRKQAYENHPLPIGHGQTISQPYIVALMTDVLALSPDSRVLEIGTGSGYQAAVLAEIVNHVYTVEIIGELADQARQTLTDVGYDNVDVLHADGYFGWEEHGPYDAIIVTAAPDHVPSPLKAQLADGGRLVIPVGPVGGYQELWLVRRDGDRFATESLGGVRFVPLTRE